MNFLAASQFFDVLTQFGELDSDTKEKRKYAKWKAANITAALKQGLQPTPGPPGGDEALLAELDNMTNSQGPERDSNPIPTPQFHTPLPESHSQPPSHFQPSPQPPSHQPPSHSQPSHQPPSHFQPSPQPQSTYTPTSAGSYTPTPEEMEKATKYARFVVSSLQFDDVPAAIKNLKLALSILTGNKGQ